MRCVFLDDAYPAAFAALPHATYEEWWQQCFGTCDYWDCALRAAGHESTTLIDNMEPDIIGKAKSLNADVICSQNVGRWPAHFLREHFPRAKLVGFCSYAASIENLSGFDVVFSSFRWLVDQLNSVGQRAVYLPLAFGKPVLDRVTFAPQRDIDVAFFGGLGDRVWKRGTETINIVAERVPGFRWWGYKISQLPPALERTYQGECWGKKYYELLGRTKICLNRHGEIARGWGNNMRQYEACGVGACLLTDSLGEINGACEYSQAETAASNAETLLAFSGMYQESSMMARQDVLANHCYENRVPAFLKAIESL